MPQLEGQDWETVVFSKPKSTNNNNSSNKAPVKLTDEQIRLNKLENGELQIKKINTDLKIKIQQARKNKNLTQADLAKKINVKQNIINDLESGKGEKNNNLLGKIERALGVKLRGKI